MSAMHLSKKLPNQLMRLQREYDDQQVQRRVRNGTNNGSRCMCDDTSQGGPKAKDFVEYVAMTCCVFCVYQQHLCGSLLALFRSKHTRAMKPALKAIAVRHRSEVPRKIQLLQKQSFPSELSLKKSVFDFFRVRLFLTSTHIFR